MTKLLDINVCRLSANNCLIVPCQGDHGGHGPCAGNIRIPFQPTIGGTQLAEAKNFWNRESGETLNDITLSPSIDAGECGHFHIVNGEIRPC